MRSMIISLGILLLRQSPVFPTGIIPTAVKPHHHRKRPRVKTWGASTLRNSAVESDRGKPPDGGGEQVGEAKTCVGSLRCVRHRRARPPSFNNHFNFLVHFPYTWTVRAGQGVWGGPHPPPGPVPTCRGSSAVRSLRASPESRGFPRERASDC